MSLSLPSINPQTQAEKIELFLKKTFSACHKKTAVLGLSGGIDSATVATLTAHALGKNNLHVLLLPSKQTETKHVDDAQTLAEFLELPSENIHEINIGAIQDIVSQTVNLYSSSLVQPSNQTATNNSSISASIKSLSPQRTGNIAARIRMLIIFDHAKALDALVVGTENLSEHYLGYYTRFGDEASDIEPIRHLYKTQVYALATYLGIPQHIIKKAPTAGLWTNQTDETEMGFSYEQADPILWQYFQNHNPLTEIIRLGYEQHLATKIFQQIAAVAFKNQVPYKI